MYASEFGSIPRGIVSLTSRLTRLGVKRAGGRSRENVESSDFRTLC